MTIVLPFNKTCKTCMGNSGQSGIE